jgi:hypothetical protein
VACLLWITVATLLQLWRSEGVPIYDTIWAEDGDFFLADALRDPVTSLLRPLSGYLQLPPRIFGLVVSVVPLEWAAVVFSGGSALVVSLLSTYVFFASRGLLSTWWSRATIAGTLVLLPAAAHESLANAANLQYYLIFACFWALVYVPKTRWGTGASFGVALAAAMNSTITVLLAPLAGYRFWKERDQRARAVSVAFFAGLAVQVVFVFRATVLMTDPTLVRYPVQWAASDPSILPGLYGLRVAAALLVGDRFLDEAWGTLGWQLAAAGILAVLAVIGYGLVRSERRGRLWISVAFGYSVLCFVMPVMARGTEHLAPIGNELVFSGNRYVLAPMWFLITALALALFDGRHNKWVRGALAFPLFLALLVVFNFRVTTLRSAGPRWSAELAAARERCAVGSPAPVEIPITPVIEPAGWTVTTSCALIDSEVGSTHLSILPAPDRRSISSFM